MPLEDYYAGDQAWRRFVHLHRTEPMSGEDWRPYKDEFQAQSLSQEDLLAVAVSYFGGERFREWSRIELDVLDGLTARECLLNPGLHIRLRECLMRLP